MESGKSSLERAFELAACGRMATVAQIRAQLKGEGYAPQQVAGRTLVRQLASIISQARE